MNRRKLGRSDLHVSELCLGTLNFGWHTNPTTAFDLLDGFLRVGGNFIQTCAVGADDAYGAATIGVAEQYVGRWLKARGIPRDDVVLASRQLMTPTDRRGDAFKTASAIRRSCEGSLRRLEIRYLDLLVFEWCEGAPMEETLLAAETLVRAGMVRHIAVSGFPAWRVMEWVAHSTRRNLLRPEAVQNEFSLVSNAGVNAESVAVAGAHRLGFIARAPLAGGFLAGRYASPGSPDSGRARLLRERYATASAAAALAEVRAISHDRGTSEARVALAWVLAHPSVNSALIGVNSTTQLSELVGATALDLSFSDLQRLDWRWRITGGNPPDDELENLPLEGPDALAALPAVNELNMENSLA